MSIKAMDLFGLMGEMDIDIFSPPLKLDTLLVPRCILFIHPLLFNKDLISVS